MARAGVWEFEDSAAGAALRWFCYGLRGFNQSIFTPNAIVFD